MFSKLCCLYELRFASVYYTNCSMGALLPISYLTSIFKARSCRVLLCQRHCRMWFLKIEMQAAPLVSTVRDLKLELYSLKQEEKTFKALLKQVSDLFFKHPGEAVLHECATTLMHCTKHGPAGTIVVVMATVAVVAWQSLCSLEWMQTHTLLLLEDVWVAVLSNFHVVVEDCIACLLSIKVDVKHRCYSVLAPWCCHHPPSPSGQTSRFNCDNKVMMLSVATCCRITRGGCPGIEGHCW